MGGASDRRIDNYRRPTQTGYRGRFLKHTDKAQDKQHDDDQADEVDNIPH